MIGLDFDNTIALYDPVFHATAVARQLINPATPVSKVVIRDAIRRQPEGETAWQALQAEIYGPLMPQARLAEGVLPFLRQCRQRQLPVCIVSHKTEFARRDTTQTNLRHAALAWMQAQGLLETAVTGLSAGDIYFESTRIDKVGRIRQLACTHFVDDLLEVFQEAAFPPTVTRILLTPGPAPAGLHAASTWDDVDRIVFPRVPHA